MVAPTGYRWWMGAVSAVLAIGCSTAPRPKPAPTVAPSLYQEALRAYWSESNSTAFVLAAITVDQDTRHAAHATYLVEVLVAEKLSTVQLKAALSDPRITPLMLDIYARGVGALKSNDAPLAFHAFRDFTLSTPSERWRAVGLTRTVPVGWGRRASTAEIDQNLRLAELALDSTPDATLAGQIAETADGSATRAQKARAAQIMTVVFDRTGELSWAEKAFGRLVETQQFNPAAEFAERILTNKSSTVSSYVLVGMAYARAGQLEHAQETLTAAKRRFGDRNAELTLGQVELYRRQQRYDDALNELLRAGREVEQFRREHYHPVWAKQFEAVALATGPDDSVYAITGEAKPRVLQVNRDGEVVAQYGPFEDLADDGTHPFAAFKDGSFLIRNRRWSSDGRILQEFPLSSNVWAVSVTPDQGIIAVGPGEGIKILNANGELLSQLSRDNCPCRGIAFGEGKILVITRNGLVHMNMKGSNFGQWDGPWVRSVAGGRDDLFYTAGRDQVKMFRASPWGGRDFIETIPLGGGAIAPAKAGGFYVAGVTTERGVWLVKFAPPAIPRE